MDEDTRDSQKKGRDMEQRKGSGPEVRGKDTSEERKMDLGIGETRGGREVYYGTQRGGGRQIQVQKSDGSTAVFDPDKVRRSLMRSGARTEDAMEITGEVERMAHPGMTEQEIETTIADMLMGRDPEALERWESYRDSHDIL